MYALYTRYWYCAVRTRIRADQKVQNRPIEDRTSTLEGTANAKTRKEPTAQGRGPATVHSDRRVSAVVCQPISSVKVPWKTRLCEVELNRAYVGLRMCTSPLSCSLLGSSQMCTLCRAFAIRSRSFSLLAPRRFKVTRSGVTAQLRSVTETSSSDTSWLSHA